MFHLSLHATEFCYVRDAWRLNIFLEKKKNSNENFALRIYRKHRNVGAAESATQQLP